MIPDFGGGRGGGGEGEGKGDLAKLKLFLNFHPLSLAWRAKTTGIKNDVEQGGAFTVILHPGKFFAND